MIEIMLTFGDDKLLSDMAKCVPGRPLWPFLIPSICTRTLIQENIPILCSVADGLSMLLTECDLSITNLEDLNSSMRQFGTRLLAGPMAKPFECCQVIVFVVAHTSRAALAQA